MGLRLNASERSLQARMAAYVLHAGRDGRDVTAPARRAFLRRFEDEVDPERVLPEAERARRAEQARKAHMTRLALASARARRARAAQTKR
jgi:hypothetical protein